MKIYLFIVILLHLLLPQQLRAKIYIDIDEPSIKRIAIAIPEFQIRPSEEKNINLKNMLPSIISHDLYLCGFFLPIEKKAFLIKPQEDPFFSKGIVQFRSWSSIGAELLLYGRAYTIGKSIEVEVWLFDTFLGKMIMHKRFLGQINSIRELMHKVSNQILQALTGEGSIFMHRFLFVDNSSGLKQIYISDYDGYNIRQLTFERSIHLFPRWLPDGKRFLYTAFTEDGHILYLQDISGGIKRKILQKKGLNIGGSFHPDGKRMAITLSLNDNPDIYIVDLNGKILKRVTRHWAIDVSPSFSPDGKRLAFVSNRSGSPQIYVLELSTGNMQRITYHGKYNTSPCWSRLNRIAYAGMENGRFDIFTINPDGSGMERLTEESGNNEDPNWSPDGRYLLFSSNRGGDYDIYLMNMRGQNQIRIIDRKGDQSSPVWSPD